MRKIGLITVFDLKSVPIKLFEFSKQRLFINSK